MINGVSINAMTIDGLSDVDKIWAILAPSITKTKPGRVSLRHFPFTRVDNEEITNAINTLQIGIKLSMLGVSVTKSIERKQRRPIVIISSMNHKPKVTVKLDETKS